MLFDGNNKNDSRRSNSYGICPARHPTGDPPRLRHCCCLRNSGLEHEVRMSHESAIRLFHKFVKHCKPTGLLFIGCFVDTMHIHLVINLNIRCKHGFLELFYLRFAGMPEWPNGHGSGPCSLVLTGVRILLPAAFLP